MNTQSFNIELLLDALTEAIATKVSERINKEESSSISGDEFLNTEEAMKFLSIKSKVTLRSYITSGLIPKPTQVGGRKLFHKKSDLIKFLSNGN